MSKNIKRTEVDNTRTAGSAVGGAILGASLGGPFGALIGGVVGAYLGESVNDSKKGGSQEKTPLDRSIPPNSNKGDPRG
ncbi:DUF456 domain-containing protein [Pseudoalteromonas marina]|uniref:DUF456 domain-containing protein n=1 Tax=Pseudoalteromonas marina TaxID=267375 RepID=UPI00399C7D43